ncbi:hypothetical protein SDC9_123301 [bioreactor metagenome]|uniref:Uncharacterized protein n=1 Tax=bioreactor metagenome TaxID=1076179 RepID=A0A645CH82_9ZZZZ
MESDPCNKSGNNISVYVHFSIVDPYILKSILQVVVYRIHHIIAGCPWLIQIIQIYIGYYVVIIGNIAISEDQFGIFHCPEKPTNPHPMGILFLG